MTTVELLSHLRSLGIRLQAEGGNLRCHAPEGSLPESLRKQVAGHKQEILAFLERAEPLPAAVADPARRYEPFPLTDVQQAYWLGRNAAYEGGNVATHVYFEVEAAALGVERLSDAWEKLIARHDMLRAIILPNGTQVVLERTPPYRIQSYSFLDNSPEAIAAHLESVRHEMSHQVLPADRWPLFDIRSTLLGGGRVRLHLSFDILIADAASIGLLLKEWFECYAEPERQLAPLDIAFRDYQVAFEKLAGSSLARRSHDYWMNRLADLPAAPELPLARQPGSIAQPRFTRRTGGLARDAWMQLKHRSQRYGLTPSIVLMAAFSEILGAWSRSPRFTLNLTLFNRLPLHPSVGRIVGDFTTLTLLEIDMAAGATFRERAARVQDQLWRDLDHPYMSGVAVMRELARARNRPPSASMPVVFTSTMSIRSDSGEPAYEDLGEVVYSISQTPQVWLDHQVTEHRGAAKFNWDSIDELFPEGVLGAMFEAYQELLRELSDSDAAWERQWREWIPARQLEVRRRVNRETATESGDLLHSGFARQAARQPGAWAVIGHRQRLTYGELWASAAGLSMLLRQRGARPNQLVAVVMEKGCEQVVAVMGILMSGAAYVPLDPALPQQRMRQLLQQAEVKLVATQSGVAERIEWPEGIEVLRVDAIDPAPDARVESRVQGVDDLAYVIYTSGSTGVPKGVMIDHRGAVNTIEDINRRFQVGPGDRVLGLSSLSFDLSVWDIFGVLAAGGALVLPAPEGERDPGQWAELLQREEVTIWNTVPALMQMLVESGAGLGRLRLCLLSGDWIPLGLPGQIREKRQEIEIISLGGATEASIWSIWRRIDEVEAGWKSIPYGKPLANQQFHVLDGGMRDCPEWVTGELYIGGPGLAKGYWGDLERTEERFVRHPVNGERLYKTGDLGRYWEDGSIEFQGREDGQVKVGGYRIELGEIEAALKEHREVKEAVVVAIGEAQANKRLAAYVVLKHAPQPLRGFISDPAERLAFKLRKPGIEPRRGGELVLLEPPPCDDERNRALLARQSYRRFLAEPAGISECAGLLSCLMESTVEKAVIAKRPYASAGGLYPVQVYLLAKRGGIDQLQPGVYYHNPALHALERVSGLPEEIEASYDEAGLFDGAGFAIYLVGKMQAIAPLYGPLARDFCLLEAGYISQLLMEWAPRFHLGLCPIGSLYPAPLIEALGLTDDRILLHSLVGGRIDAGQMRQWTPGAETAGEHTPAERLRRFLERKLPAYMAPSSIAILETLPLTANGKVDRKAIGALAAAAQPKPRESGRPPESQLECKLAGIVERVLERDGIGIETNFFDLGANSFSIVQIQNEIRRELGVEVPVVELFRNPRLSLLAGFLLQERPSNDDGLLEAVERAERRRAEKRRRENRQAAGGVA